MSIQFPYIEDYIQFIAGSKVISNGSLINANYGTESPLRLATYDVEILKSFSNQINSQIGFTEKQAALAQRICYKYRKQLASLDPSIIIHDNFATFKIPIRKVDVSKILKLRDNKLILKFPFDTKLIDLIREQSRDGVGQFEFNKESKEWSIALTEHNVNWAVTVAANFDISVSSEVADLFELIVECEKIPFEIKLRDAGDKLTIDNADSNLVEYIEQHLGGFGKENLFALVDNASVLGYTVDAGLEYRTLAGIDDDTARLVKSRECAFTNNEKIFETIMQYAEKSNRLPVYIYSNGTPKPDTDKIKYLKLNNGTDIRPKLLITQSRLMIGSTKQAWLRNAEKVIVIDKTN